MTYFVRPPGTSAHRHATCSVLGSDTLTTYTPEPASTSVTPVVVNAWYTVSVAKSISVYPTVVNPLIPAGNKKFRVLTSVATILSGDGFVSPLPLVIETENVPAAAAVYWNVPVEPTPAASATGVLVTVPPEGVTFTVTLTDDASEPFVPIVNTLDALPTGTALGPVSVNAVAAAGA